jgi:hypothetical protein
MQLRNRFLPASAVLTVALLQTTIASGSPITWSSATTISADSDVSTLGTLVQASDIGGPGLTGATVNGVTFAPFALSGISATQGIFTFASTETFASNNSVGSAIAPYSGLSTNYRALLDDTAGNFVAPFTLTISGLTIGQNYLFEWWWALADYRFPNVLTTAAAGNSVSLNANTTTALGGLGQFATGTFMADATTELITFSHGSEDIAGINGLQLRQLDATSPVPEPATLLLFGTGLAAVGVRRLKKRA